MMCRMDRPAGMGLAALRTGKFRFVLLTAAVLVAGWLALGFSQSQALAESSSQLEGVLLAQAEGAKAAPGAPAPTTPTQPAAGELEALPSFVRLFETSPIINGIIIALSGLALLLFIFFLLTINHNAMVPAAFVDDVMKMVLAREHKQAVDFCRHHRGIFVSTVIQRAVENADKDQAVIMDMVDTEGKRRADMLWNRLSYLADISNVAPMLGLLGTVMGMMRAFFGLDQSDMSLRSKAISSDIAGAMATTFFGLIVGILALVFYSIIKGRLTKVLGEAEAAVHAVADHLKRGEK
ncbi:MAG: MotA/TolQ/ExbB proton channel family protein [Phycisphaeraceae bacterium]